MISHTTTTIPRLDLYEHIVLLTRSGWQDIARRAQSALHIKLVLVSPSSVLELISDVEKENYFRLTILQTLQSEFDLKVELPKRIRNDKEHLVLASANLKVHHDAKRGSAVRTYLLFDRPQSFMISPIENLLRYTNLRLIILTDVHPGNFLGWKTLRIFNILEDSSFEFGHNPQIQLPALSEYELVTFYSVFNAKDKLLDGEHLCVKAVFDYMRSNLGKIPHAYLIQDNLIENLTRLDRLNLVSMWSIGDIEEDWRITVAPYFLRDGMQLLLDYRVGILLSHDKGKLLCRTIFTHHLLSGSTARGLILERDHSSSQPSEYRFIREVLICAQSRAKLETLQDKQLLRLPVKDLCSHLLISLDTRDRQTHFDSVGGLLNHLMEHSNYIFEYNASNHSVDCLPDIADCIDLIGHILTHFRLSEERLKDGFWFEIFEALMTEETNVTQFKNFLSRGTAAIDIFNSSMLEGRIGKRTVGFLRFLIWNTYICKAGPSVCGRCVYMVSIHEINTRIARSLCDESYASYFGETFVRTEDLIICIQSLVPVLEYDPFRSRVVILPDIECLKRHPALYEDSREDDEVNSKLEQLSMVEEEFRSYLEESGLRCKKRKSQME